MIEVVLLDVDGILTDGSVYVDASGAETKKILFDDIDAIFELKRSGIKIGFITGEDNKFCQYVRNRFSPDYFISGCKDKLVACKNLIKEEGFLLDSICYAGDSKKDIGLLNFVPLSFAPADVDSDIQLSAKIILRKGRGHGVIKELAEYILNNKNNSSF